MSDFATNPEEFDIDFWETGLGQQTLTIVSHIDKGSLPEQGLNAIKEILDMHHSGTKVTDLGDFNASQQAINLANLLTKAMNHYMPGGIIDDGRASPSDIKNLISTSSSVVKLINQVQNELYTADRMAAMERAIFKTFDGLGEIKGISPESGDELKKTFRKNLEMAFSSL